MGGKTRHDAMTEAFCTRRSMAAVQGFEGTGGRLSDGQHQKRHAGRLQQLDQRRDDTNRKSHERPEFDNKALLDLDETRVNVFAQSHQFLPQVFFSLQSAAEQTCPSRYNSQKQCKRTKLISALLATQIEFSNPGRVMMLPIYEAQLLSRPCYTHIEKAACLA